MLYWCAMPSNATTGNIRMSRKTTIKTNIVEQRSTQTATSTSAGPRAMPGSRSSTWLWFPEHWATLPTRPRWVWFWFLRRTGDWMGFGLTGFSLLQGKYDFRGKRRGDTIEEFWFIVVLRSIVLRVDENEGFCRGWRHSSLDVYLLRNIPLVVSFSLLGTWLSCRWRVWILLFVVLLVYEECVV